MKKIRHLNLLVFIFLSVSLDLHAGCSEIKSKIESNIKSNGVKKFSLDVVPFAQEYKGKIVGNCENRKYKIMYLKYFGSSLIKEVEKPKKYPLPYKDSFPPYFDGMKNLNIPYDEASNSGVNWFDLSPEALVTTLHKWRNKELYYNGANWPANMIAIMARIKTEQFSNMGESETLDKVIQAYKLDEPDDLFRFNLIGFLMEASFYQFNTAAYAKPSAIRSCLLLATKDVNPWVRTEAVYALQSFKGKDVFDAAKKLEKDMDATVAKEAKKTVDILTERGWTSSE